MNDLIEKLKSVIESLNTDWNNREHPSQSTIDTLSDMLPILTAAQADLERKKDFDEWKKIAGEYSDCLQRLVMDRLYRVCEPISHKWPGMKHVDTIGEGVEFLIKQNAVMKADLDRMPVTADGKRVMPGSDRVYHPHADGPMMIVDAEENYFEDYKRDNEMDAPDSTEFFASWYYYESDTNYRESLCKLIGECYSTPEASALAAKEKP